MPSIAVQAASAEQPNIRLELDDGFSCEGLSYGAQKSVSGELVFQTGMVGYPESLTDPSYRGQILVCTFPLAGNYGVPSRKALDKLLKDLPAYFESSEIHVAGLVTASYSGENFSHFLAESSLGTWLKENGVPAVHAVDTRALTKRIRTKGSMLGRLLISEQLTNGVHHQVNGHSETNGDAYGSHAAPSRFSFSQIPFIDPNARNLVADGTTLENAGYDARSS